MWTNKGQKLQQRNFALLRKKKTKLKIFYHWCSDSRVDQFFYYFYYCSKAFGYYYLVGRSQFLAEVATSVRGCSRTRLTFVSEAPAVNTVDASVALSHGFPRVLPAHRLPLWRLKRQPIWMGILPARLRRLLSLVNVVLSY